MNTDEHGTQQAARFDILHNDELGNVRLQDCNPKDDKLNCMIYCGEPDKLGQMVEVDPNYIISA